MLAAFALGPAEDADGLDVDAVVDQAAAVALAGIDVFRFLDADDADRTLLLRVAGRTHELYEARLTSALAAAFGSGR